MACRSSFLNDLVLKAMTANTVAKRLVDRVKVGMAAAIGFDRRKQEVRRFAQFADISRMSISRRRSNS
jgi:hypothetical protein